MGEVKHARRPASRVSIQVKVIELTLFANPIDAPGQVTSIKGDKYRYGELVKVSANKSDPLSSR